MPSLDARWVRSAVLACFGLAAVISLNVGVRHALQYSSHDLQWMGGKLLANHIDPWNEVLSRYPHHVARFSPPNYLHLLYLLWLPFTALPFVPIEIGWCVLSIGFSVASVVLLRKMFELSRFQTLLLLFLLWMSSPFRVVLETGQMSLFELFFFCLTFVATTSWIAGVAFGVSAIKYSFSPVAAVVFLLRGRFRVLLLAAMVSLLGLLGVKLLLATPLLQLAREPFLVSRTAVSPGLADIMTLSEYALRPSWGMARAASAAYAVAFAASVLFAFLISRFRLSRQADFVLISLASLLFFKHLLYDYVFLAIPLAYAFKHKKMRAKAPVFAGVFVFWFLAAALDRASTEQVVHVAALAVNCGLLFALCGYTTYIALQETSA